MFTLDRVIGAIVKQVSYGRSAFCRMQRGQQRLTRDMLFMQGSDGAGRQQVPGAVVPVATGAERRAGDGT